MGTEELGIEKLQEFVFNLADLGMDLDRSLEDGKISISEGLSMAIENIPDFVEDWRDRKEILAQWKDADSAEKENLKTALADHLDIRNDKAENLIEKLFALSMALDDVVDAFRDLKKE
ncbi:hypothetical protein KA005_37445 [bacterium]|nr:hypothetical protein [bacterium]